MRGRIECLKCPEDASKRRRGANIEVGEVGARCAMRHAVRQVATRDTMPPLVAVLVTGMRRLGRGRLAFLMHI